MREILFRGKRKSDGEWVLGYVVPTTTNTYGKGVDIIDTDGIDYDELNYFRPGFCSDPVVPETVGQFTGLTDKNGKKIFEGDILTLRTRRPHIVKFEDGGFVLTGTAIPICHANKFEVIGNIHDHHELLKGGVEECG